MKFYGYSTKVLDREVVDDLIDIASDDVIRHGSLNLMGIMQRQYTVAGLHLVLLPSGRMVWEEWYDALTGLLIFADLWDVVELYFDVNLDRYGSSLGIGYLRKVNYQEDS